MTIIKMKHNKKVLYPASMIAVAICCVCLLFFLNSGGKRADTAEIYYYKRLLCTVDLSAGAQTFVFPEAPGVCIEVNEKGEIFFRYSDCPDKICVKTGKLSHTGQSAACLPRGIVVKIIGGENELDAITFRIVGTRPNYLNSLDNREAL